MTDPPLARRLGVTEATLLGLGAVVGTGVFVSIGVAADAAGPGVIVATALAALLATANALNSAQLAASHPVSGGTYEYGYRYLAPSLGFAAGWMFVCAKTASAATAALGVAGYVVQIVDADRMFVVPIAAAVVVAITAIVFGGMRRSSRVNTLVVSITLGALVLFCLAGLPVAWKNGGGHLAALVPQDAGGVGALLEATALMFVAFTGYGRVATLGEEVRDPRRTIPRAIVFTLIVSASLYLAVATVAVAAVGADRLAAATTGQAAPLTEVAATFGVRIVPSLVAVGAVTAMLGVLLNLVLGVSRVVLAMARRGDLPAMLARIDPAGATPGPAVIATGTVIVGLTLIGSVKTAWSFSAFTVLVYYAVTNLAALRLPSADRLYPRWLAGAGLAGCLGLAFFVDPAIWAAGLTVLGTGLIWHVYRGKNRAARQRQADGTEHGRPGDRGTA